jgi:L-fuconolactonase
MAHARIDAHQHFWRYRAEAYPWIGPGMEALAVDRLPADVLPHLRAQGMDAAIAVQARGTREETRFLLDLANQHDWLVGVVGWEDLAADDLETRLQAWSAEPKLRGFRHQVQDEPDAEAFLFAPNVSRGAALLQVWRYAYDVLVFDHQIAAAAAFCARHDNYWLVLDHLGKPPLAAIACNGERLAQWKVALEPFRRMFHVACKLSGLVTEADWRAGLGERDLAHIARCLDVALDVFGPQRLMFGSDWPVCLLAAPYNAVHDIVRRWAADRLSVSERDDIWGRTAARCYDLALPA